MSKCAFIVSLGVGLLVVPASAQNFDPASTVFEVPKTGPGFVQLPTTNACDPTIPFDDGLSELNRSSGGEQHVAMAGVGTKDGGNSFTIDVDGTPTAAWIYWLGETQRDANGDPAAPDPCIDLSGGAIAGTIEICGVESGRRIQLFTDESQGGEVAMRGEVPLSSFNVGSNTFTVTNFNERVPPNNDRIYRRTYGVSMQVVYDVAGGSGDWTVISQDGMDIANFRRYGLQTVNCDAEEQSAVACFTFDALADCDHSARLRFAVGGMQPLASDPTDQIWFVAGSGSFPNAVINLGDLLATDALSGSSNVGEDISVFESDVLQLPAGTTFACFQVELSDAPFQNLALHQAALEFDASCPQVGAGCITRTPGFWKNHPHVSDDFLPVSSAGITLDNSMAATQGSTVEDMCVNGKEAKNVDTSMQQLQLLRQCAAARLNLAASSSDGGNCESDHAGIGARLDYCCGDLANSGADESTISSSLCIDDIDAFNNSDDTLDPFGPFLSPGPANSDPCKASNKNGFVNGGRNLGPR